ncbi:MAG: NAD(P)H-quinone oxidoreductase [Nocardioidaceae bacterium]
MRAVVCREPGGPEVLEIQQVAEPAPGAGDVVIDIVATAVNRADLMQREGRYPPPPGASDVLGLECAGTVSSVGADVGRWQLGDQVCALLTGGGYADKVSVPAGQVLPVPDGLDTVQAAALPEVAATVWSNLVMVARLQAGEVLLVHGGGGGIGTMAIQVAKALGARVACTVGSEAKAQACRALGADVAISYRDQDFVDEVRRLSAAGADVILDNMGAAYLGRNVEALAAQGRLVVIGLQGGAKGELDLRTLLGKRGAVHATALRSRPAADKAEIVAQVEKYVWPMVASGVVRPIVHTTVALDDIRSAHELVESSSSIGKVVVTT